MSAAPNRKVVSLLALFFAVFICFILVEAKGGSKLRPKHEWKRRRTKSSECRLGGKRYELYEKWSPNLGPPFGVWFCVRCECKPHHRKRRVVGRVKCANMKHECPKVTCDDAIIPPGQCCKACPDKKALQYPLDIEPEEEELTDFAVLLNGRTSLNPLTTESLATGRLSLRRKNLHFSFLLEDDKDMPLYVRFLDHQGKTLEEFEVRSTPYEVTNNRVCGTWTNVPPDYIKMLKDAKMYVSLVLSEDDDEISGIVDRYVGTDTEVFSALLQPSEANVQKLRGGGTAVISVAPRSDSLHISLIFNGIFAKTDESDVHVVVELIPKRKSITPVQEVVIQRKVYSEINTAVVMTTLGETSLPLLTRGRVYMKVYSRDAPQLAIEGLITARVSCNVFFASMSYQPADEAKDEEHGAGWGLLTVSNEGDMNYNIYFQGIQEKVKYIRFESKRKKNRIFIHDITKDLKDDWANGTYSRPRYSDLGCLLRGKLEIVTETENTNKLVGDFNQVSVTPALYYPFPVLLTSLNSTISAVAWVAVDADCIMHYDVMVGVPNKKKLFWKFYLKENDTKWDPRFEAKQILLEELVMGRELSDHTAKLERLSLSRIGAGVSFLELVLLKEKSVDNGISATLRGWIRNVEVPSHCQMAGTDATTQRSSDSCKGIDCFLDAGSEVVRSRHCIDNTKKVYKDGSRWQSPENVCRRCMCTSGKIMCIDEPCPPLPCSNPVTRKEQCCPYCSNDTEGKGVFCELDNLSYAIGSVWHPFVSPMGFDKCTKCSCKLKDSVAQLDCKRADCPLNCSPFVAKQPKSGCCKVCPPASNVALNKPAWIGMHRDKQMLPGELYSVRSGDCFEREKVRKNGEEWHPRIASFGEVRCITCRCKDSILSCEADKLNCSQGKRRVSHMAV